MLNISKTISLTKFLLSFLSCCAYTEDVVFAAHDTSGQIITRYGIESRLEANNKHFLLSFKRDTGKLIFSQNNKSIELEKINKIKSPFLIRAEKEVGILPIKLQPYLKDNILLVIWAERSRENNGGGQCGSGGEIYLMPISISKPTPRLISRVLIASCVESILINDETKDHSIVSALGTQNGVLRINLFAYKGDTTISYALLSKDLSELIFQNHYNNR